MYSFRTGGPVAGPMKLVDKVEAVKDVKNCDCKYCERGKEFETQLDKIQDIDSKKFFENLYDALCETEERLGLYKIYLDDLKKKDINMYRTIKRF